MNVTLPWALSCKAMDLECKAMDLECDPAMGTEL